ncbi:MAG TPA: hypothetical protein VFE90_11235, partial [Myxococcales bacterium]|nr:hypothetical protein [Myxococcales bacterium]
LVDHDGVPLVPADAGNAPPTEECQASCTTAPTGATPYCGGSDGNQCLFECQNGKLHSTNGCADATQVSAGNNHTCAVSGSEVHCWGANERGQLGASVGATSFVPVTAPLVGGASEVAAGGAHSCAIVAGEVWCWGDNTSGQLGSAGSAGGPTPVKVQGISGAIHLAAGDGHTCAMTAVALYCWGRNDLGQLGNGTTAPESGPLQVGGVTNPNSIAAGQSHTCAVTGSGAICWGSNGSGQVGNGTQVLAVPTPTAVSPSISGVSSVSAGPAANHMCALTSSGALACWGANLAGQIDGSNQDQHSPKGVLSGIRAVSGGTGHSCALTTGQVVKCWGNNDQGQVGSPALGSNKPQIDVGLSGVGAISSGNKHNCAIVGGAVLCWGLNQSGQLGSDAGANAFSATPLPVSGR